MGRIPQNKAINIITKLQYNKCKNSLNVIYLDFDVLLFKVSVLKYPYQKTGTLWVICRSLPTFDDLDLVYMDLCSPRFPRVLIYMICYT